MKKSLKKTVSEKKSTGFPLAVISFDGTVYMIERVDKKTTSSLLLSMSTNGIDFVPSSKRISITNGTKKENVKLCNRFSLSKTPNGYVMTYLRDATSKLPSVIVLARSNDMFNWKTLCELPADEFHHTSIVYDKEKDSFELYRDGLFIKSQESRTLAVWKEKPQMLFTSRNTYFDAGRISIIGTTVIQEGILLLYDATVEDKNKVLLQAGAVIFDAKVPKRVLWRSAVPIWQAAVDAPVKTLPIEPLGFVTFKDKFIIYWVTQKGEIIVAVLPKSFKEIEDRKLYPKILARFDGNPIIEPRVHADAWEGEGTFNPAVVEDDEGTIHLLYRALGRDGISRIGYAQSKDGIHFNNRSNIPVYEPTHGFGLPDESDHHGPIGYHQAMYTSGGGWGGSEDPRIVRIGDDVYMTYVAFEGWDSVRIALTSISLDDFKRGRWKWRKPQLISPPGKVNKNWLIFPEKINGKFAVLHSIVPKVMIEYVDDLKNFNGYINSKRPDGPQPGPKGSWDNILRGAGPPPMKTQLGWLLLYHALENKDSGRYKLGAMILDKNDPTKILYRSAHPILSPDMYYENNGKPGIVYASGANIRGDDLYVYYGGADKVVCVATTPLDQFLKYLVTGNAKSYELKKV